MVGVVARHELIARDAMQDDVHDGPLRRGLPPAALGFFRGQLDDVAEADVDVQAAAFDEDAAPDDLARAADALQRAAAEPEIHGRLALADGAA